MTEHLNEPERELLAKAKAAKTKRFVPGGYGFDRCSDGCSCNWQSTFYGDMCPEHGTPARYEVVMEANPAAIIELLTRLAAARDIWLEFLTPEQMCGLCGQSGVIDTRPLNLHTPAGTPCGVKRYCICPNGRALLAARGPAAGE